MSTLADHTRTGLAPFDPFHPDFLADPYRFYATYRESDPVHWGTPPEPMAPGCWYILRHDDARQALDDPRFCVELGRAIPRECCRDSPPFQPFFDLIGDWLIFRDPPDHAAAQAGRRGHQPQTSRAMSRAYTTWRTSCWTGAAMPEPRRHRRLRRLAQVIIAELLDAARQPRAAACLVEGDLAGISLRQSDEAPRLLRRQHRRREFSAHIREVTPSGTGERVLSADDAADAEQLSDRKLVATCIMLFAGHETTVNLIGNGVLALLRAWRALELLRQRKDLINGAVEELARYDSPGQMTFRFATEDVEMRGKRIGRGEPIAVVLGAANRDPNVFPNAAALDITRRQNPHLAFGSGRHNCLGSGLARIEARIAIPALLDRMPGMQLLRDTQEWNRSIGLRGLAALPVGSPAGARSPEPMAG